MVKGVGRVKMEDGEGWEVIVDVELFISSESKLVDEKLGLLP